MLDSNLNRLMMTVLGIIILGLMVFALFGDRISSFNSDDKQTTTEVLTDGVIRNAEGKTHKY